MDTKINRKQRNILGRIVRETSKKRNSTRTIDKVTKCNIFAHVKLLFFLEKWDDNECNIEIGKCYV